MTTSAIIFQIQSCLIVSLMFFGIYNRRNRSLHVKTMLTTIIWDILLVLQIELSRGAIGKASKAVTNPIILNIHVSFAVSSVLLYFVMLYTGGKLLKGDNSIRSKHKFFGITCATLRVLTLITSFWAVAK